MPDEEMDHGPKGLRVGLEADNPLPVQKIVTLKTLKLCQPAEMKIKVEAFKAITKLWHQRRNIHMAGTAQSNITA
jgi:hypothetical protein